MKIRTIRSEQAAEVGRLDAWYFTSPATDVLNTIGRLQSRGLVTRKLGGTNGLAHVWKPDRSRLCFAAWGEPSVPYLRPYDVFKYYPEASDWLSERRTKDLDTYQLKRNTILQTCSGRNLGPAAYVDEYLEQFVVGADMIRISTTDEKTFFYLLAFLNSRSGRSLIRRPKSGSVIDHLDVGDLGDVNVPLLTDSRMSEISGLVSAAVKMRESARMRVQSLIRSYEKTLPPIARTKHLREGWTLLAGDLDGRLDAAFHDPLVKLVRRELAEIGGKPLTVFASVLKPAGRYKTCYVDAAHGLPLLSGTQLLQTRLINPQFMAPRVFKNVQDYELSKGWIAYQADGRAEEDLGNPIVVTKDRDRWLSSGHVGRVIPKPGTDTGWLFLALKTEHSQIQIKARASGSVVDSTFEDDMEATILPPKSVDGKGILEAWDAFAEAQIMEDKASAMVDDALTGPS
jgi:hypothetical protein